jgi:hypothetical protein
MKLTLSKLKSLIREELTDKQKDRLNTLKGKESLSPEEEEEKKNIEHQ